MIPNRFSDTLFQLIKSLEKAEKRHFKLFAKRSSANEDLKIIELFDVLDKMPLYDEVILLKKLSSIKKPQLSNIKVHLYKQLLASLRLLKSTDSLDLQLTEQLDYAHILYKKGLFAQSLKILDKAKETANNNHKVNILIQIISLEKRIETLHITRDMQTRALQLSTEVNDVNKKIDMHSRLSNLAMLLQSWFIQYGHTRNIKDEQNVKQYMQNHLPENAWQQNGFYERIYLYQSFCTYAYIRQDFVSYYKYAQKWVNLFEESPMMLRVETSHYIKAMHSLLNAHFVLRNFQQFDIVLAKFIIFSETDRVKLHDNFRTQAFISIYSAKINQHNMLGTFKEGIKIVPFVLEQIKLNELFIDEYRVMVFNYKIASLYFGNGNFDKCIDFLQKIIQQTGDERNDLQGYARILHLIAHYELGNFELMEYLTKSVFRFLSKKEYLTEIEKEMFKYLRNSFSISRKELLVALNELLVKIKKLEKNAFETRVFTYLDLVSWIESKVNNKTMEHILQEKNKQRKVRNYA
jgi:hypothetical protein